MVITEAHRFKMHTKLRHELGEEVADTLMEHLPPIGWGEVVAKSDVAHVRRDIERVERRLNWFIGIGTTVGLALLGMQLQIMLSIAQLKG